MRLRVISRLLQIQRVLVRHRLDEIIVATHLFRPVRFAFYLSPNTWFRRKASLSRGERLRLALEELGPIFMKFGQTLSTRRDLLPRDIADELEKLQDRVPPFSNEAARAIVEAAYERPTSDVFARFDPAPLAAATIAQVHGAQLKDGKEVVVKIVRPGIRKLIERDVEVLYALADLANRYWSDAPRLRPVELVREYQKTILDELDLKREAANAAQLRRNFVGSRLLYVPEVYWDYTRSNVMVMERVQGVLINDVEELQRRGANIQRLAENGVEIFFTQAFRHNFFHADMHPGNIFVLLDNPEQPQYAAVDFGIVGTLAPRDQHYLAENFLAFFEHDYRRIAQLHIDSGWIPAHVRVDELESAVRTVCEPIANKPLREISFGQVLISLFEAAQRFDAQMQPQLMLIQKTLLQIEGVGRQLYPDLDLWKTAQPLLRQWVAERWSLRALARDVKKQLPDMLQALHQLPPLIENTIQRASDGRLSVPVESKEIERLQQTIREDGRRRDVTLVTAIGALSGVVLLATGAGPEWLGYGLLGASIVGLLALRK
ncbi:ubiquinone biosynthesis regulatory protein kinase UbiB [Steroidobacter sp.]|uniref:ubiquinone biosynthesis regulatory protein kinase UbiB n=1 Tax=Steroidobacter sp. TaxID=1978227 RepID=UPI001A5605E7|nr:ubiquinone biosynthesis regulatory protein kinase UbiB [Steroidobacter sp.]MBL8264762.1 ubiquinone biosynthesis regulatory protein kinase UbiB [Steroidobacter sp.]